MEITLSSCFVLFVTNLKSGAKFGLFLFKKRTGDLVLGSPFFWRTKRFEKIERN